MMWNCIGQRCHICLKAYEDEGQPNDTSYRKQILLTCSLHLVSELGVDWNSVSTDEYLPFCAQCLESIEGIIKYHEDSEKIQSDIKACVQRLMVKALKSRKQMKHKGVILSWANTGVKMEILDQQNCVSCYNFYPNECQNHQLPYEVKKNILEQCKLHLYSDFITNSGGFDWNTIPEREILPFCPSCFVSIDKICDLGNSFNNNEAESVEFLDAFLIQAFECRDALKKKTLSRNSTYALRKTSLCVDAGKTTIVIKGRRPVTEVDDCYMVSASDEPRYSSENEKQGPRIVETTTLNRPEDVSSTNQSGSNGGQPDLARRMSGSLPPERAIHSKKQITSENAAVEANQQPTVTKTRIFIDKQLVINSVSDIVLPAGTSIEELPPAANHDHVSENEAEEVIIEDVEIENESSVSPVKKPRKKRRFRFSEGSKIRTRSRCGKCNRSFTYQRNYVKHKETCPGLGNFPIPTVPAKTTEPEKTFGEMPQLQVEYSNYPDVQMESVTDSFTCTYPNCSKIFLNKANLERHISMHEADRPHQCNNCGATFVQLNHLKNHSRQKNCIAPAAASAPANWNSTPRKTKQNKSTAGSSTKKQFSFVCIYCGFSARNSTILSNHLQEHVEIADESRCPNCSHVCSNRHTLKLHVKRKHATEVRPDIPFEQVLQLISDRSHHDQANPSGLWVQSGFVQSD